jgi:hypothetical protein
MDRAFSYPFGRTSAAQFVHNLTQIQTGTRSRQPAKRWRAVQAQPADAALVWIARPAWPGNIAVDGIATNVGTAVTETRKVFHSVTLKLSAISSQLSAKHPTLALRSYVRSSVASRSG